MFTPTVFLHSLHTVFGTNHIWHKSRQKKYITFDQSCNYDNVFLCSKWLRWSDFSLIKFFQYFYLDTTNHHLHSTQILMISTFVFVSSRFPLHHRHTSSSISSSITSRHHLPPTTQQPASLSLPPSHLLLSHIPGCVRSKGWS